MSSTEHASLVMPPTLMFIEAIERRTGVLAAVPPDREGMPEELESREHTLCLEPDHPGAKSTATLSICLTSTLAPRRAFS